VNGDECCVQMKNLIHLLRLKHAFRFGIYLYCFLFCLAAFGAGEISVTYSYKGFDTNGSLLVTGDITLHLGDTSKVNGDWTLQVLDKSRLKELGHQDGTGKIVGTLKSDNSIVLNLNPEEFGDNIYLNGKVANANVLKISGKWGHYGY
jgi:hypothetical protein